MKKNRDFRLTYRFISKMMEDGRQIGNSTQDFEWYQFE